MSIYILYIYIYICAGCINYKPYPQVCVCVFLGLLKHNRFLDLRYLPNVPILCFATSWKFKNIFVISMSCLILLDCLIYSKAPYLMG